MHMFLPTILFFGALGYLFYSSKKELFLDYDVDDDLIVKNTIEKDESNKDLKDLFI